MMTYDDQEFDANATLGVSPEDGPQALEQHPPAWHIDEHDRIYIDTTMLTAVARCSTKALVQYAYGYHAAGEEPAYLKSGTAGHEAMATYFKTWDAATALETFRELYEAWAEENVPNPDDRLTYQNTSRILSQWFALHPRNALPFFVRPDLVEVPFAIDIADDVIFVGRMDLIAQDATDSAWWIVDHKFTGDIRKWDWSKQFRYSPQLSGYIYAAQRHTDRTVVGAYINAIEFSRMPKPGGPTLCKVHELPFNECGDRHLTKTGKPQTCRVHHVPYMECGHLHVRTCQTHGVPSEDCAQLHTNSQILTFTRTPHEINEWQKTAVRLARQFKELIRRFPTIDSIDRVRTQGQFTGECGWCGLADWCLSGRSLDNVGTMLTYRPWRPWEYQKKEGEE